MTPIRTETVGLRHPLFDPSSAYGRMRASVRAEDKMRGYLHWLWVRAKRTQGPLPCASQRPEVERRELACRLEIVSGGPGIEVLDALEARAEALVAGPTEAILPPRFFADAELCLVREVGGPYTLGLLLWGAGLFRAAHFRCRAFLLEPEVVERLEGHLGGRPYLDAFHPDAVENNLEVARVLAAVPEMEGDWEGGRSPVCFHRLPTTDHYDLFPPRTETLQIVVVLHPADTNPSSS
jgi:hypothetical protein